MSGVGRLRQENRLKLHANLVKQTNKQKNKTDEQMDRWTGEQVDRWTVVTRSPRTEPQGSKDTSDDSSVPGDRQGSAHHLWELCTHSQDQEGSVLSGGGASVDSNSPCALKKGLQDKELS